jgi:RNA polymerase sigma-70 factor, ECF subfamily
MTDRDRSENAEAARALIIQQVVAMQSDLRAFAMSLCNSADKADDLVQETMLRGISKLDTFQPGTNLGAWLTTILRNCFLSGLRKHRNEVEDADGAYALGLRAAPEQEARLEFKEFRAALSELPFNQREALLLVGAAGLSYEDAATLCHTRISTIKSRINRARSGLAALLAIDGADHFGFDSQTRAILTLNQGLGPAQWIG